VVDLKRGTSRQASEHDVSPGRPYLPPEAADLLDPLHIPGTSAKPMSLPSMADHAPEIFTPFAPPAARQDPALGVQAGPMPPVVAQRPPEPPATPSVAMGRGDNVPEVGDRLLEAFLQGAGIADPHLPRRLTPDGMRAVGQLFRQAVQGTLDLLRARGLMKSEMRADVTKITPADNNPLKFSPTVETALVHLLAPHVPGYCEPVLAMKSAYDDLRAHHLGFLAGMRAALDEVLARFSPADLEKRIADPSVLDNLLPMNRKAKQWDLFVERYESLAGEAREDFNTAFGRAFRRAYEAQVNQLRRDDRRE
jgi:FHA domain-containing protein